MYIALIKGDIHLFFFEPNKLVFIDITNLENENLFYFLSLMVQDEFRINEFCYFFNEGSDPLPIKFFFVSIKF